jgi:hypothetical protein
MEKSFCKVDYCDKVVFVKGLCQSCYQKKRYKPIKKEVKYCECGSEAKVKGLCQKCYNKNRTKKSVRFKKPNKIIGINDVYLLLERGFTTKKACEKLNLTFKDFYSNITDKEKTNLKQKEIYFSNKIKSLTDLEEETLSIIEEFDLRKMILRTNKVILSIHKFKSKKPILQFTLDGVFICKYESMSEAQISGVDIASISRICNGLQKPNRFIFKYEEDELSKEPLDDLLYFLN